MKKKCVFRQKICFFEKFCVTLQAFLFLNVQETMRPDKKKVRKVYRR